MARKWTELEEKTKRRELQRLYVKENKTISEIARVLKLGESSVYDRLVRLSIPTLRSEKHGFNNRRADVVIPQRYSEELAEFIGIMLGDGHLAPTQVTVALGKKERSYIEYISRLIQHLFNVRPRIFTSKKNNYIVYFGSTDVVRWLQKMGLVSNKVKSQVDAPGWIFDKKQYLRSFLRGFFDTDGSVYKLRFGVQVSFTNRSLPILRSLQKTLKLLGYSPSAISKYCIYLTKRSQVRRFFQEIQPSNQKHQLRFEKFINQRAGRPVGSGA